MKNKLCKIFLFIFLLLGFTNVYAEEVPVKELPKSYSTKESEGYEYIIEGFELKIYNVTVVNDNEIDEGFEKYIAETPDKTINLTFDDLTINPESKETTINGVPATFIDLNLNLTKEKLAIYLETELKSATPNKAYLVELALKYKLTKQKQETIYRYRIDYLKDFFRLEETGKFVPKSFELNTSQTQTINIMTVGYDNKSKQNIIDYQTEATIENALIAYILNYLAFSNVKLEEQGNEKKASDMIFFHNIDNIDYLIESLQETNDDDNKKDDPAQDAVDKIKDKLPSTGTNIGQEVAVGNTAATIPSYFYIISVIMVITGIGIIGYIVIKE